MTLPQSHVIPFSLPTLSAWKKKQYLRHAQRFLEAHQHILSPDGKNILHYTLKDTPRHERMKHYPKGDRIDYNTGAQYFYHCHRENFDSEEHGHFHCFLRYKQIPKRIKPRPLADWDKHIDSPMTHLVAIALNRYGEPIRLFAVNRWVSSEIWYDARHTANFIQRYQLKKQDDPYWQILDQWIDGIVHLFAPQIIWLNQQRDRLVNEQILRHPELNVFEHESFEELAEIPINLKQQIDWILT